MNKAADSTTKQTPHNSSPFAAGTLAFDFLDTAWRMAVPVILFAVAGLLLDKKIDSAPWLTLLGVVIGFVFSGILVKKQIDAINRKERNQEKK